MVGSKRRLWWAIGPTILALVALGRFKLAYDYSHVPLRTAMVPRPYPQTGQSVQGLAFSPDGRTLLVADTQAGVSLWHLPSLVCDRRFENADWDTPSYVNWTADGRTIVVGDSSAVRRWDVSQGRFEAIPTQQVDFQGKAVKEGRVNISQIHAVSPLGALGAGASTEGDVIVWNLRTGKSLFHVNALPPGKFGYPTDFCDVAMSPDDRQVATTSMQGDDSVALAPVDVTIRDANTGRVQRQWQWKKAIIMKVGDSSGGNLGDTGLTFSSDGMHLAVADDYKVSVWDVRQGVQEHTLSMDNIKWSGGRKMIVFFGGGHLLACTGWGPEVSIWNVDQEREVQAFYGPEYIQAMAVSQDGHFLAVGGQESGGDGVLQLWDVHRLLR